MAAKRINAEAARIQTCIKNARRMRQVSEASVNGAVGGRVGRDGDATYAALSLSAEPADDAALAKAAEAIVEAYKRTALAALASENRGTTRWRRRSTSRPTISCPTSAARRRALRCSGGRR
ncbi:hypothetical protein AMK06_PD00418 (plasmid) [Rhizobium sp. N541]|nr:hypothetical protein AMK05_PD00416 [Rhizobium sp. N324]ANM20696.1 hypothetical protein AMK06_PD00418 [Rhizobium sp. N541]ANM27080.1 hypothetical protein AMK07_PD00418 [Rhizobium sp. N941]OYD00485.1 hypothetical protein AMK08_PD00416 [Rhizobium sp. N4311]